LRSEGLKLQVMANLRFHKKEKGDVNFH